MRHRSELNMCILLLADFKLSDVVNHWFKLFNTLMYISSDIVAVDAPLGHPRQISSARFFQLSRKRILTRTRKTNAGVPGALLLVRYQLLVSEISFCTFSLYWSVTLFTTQYIQMLSFFLIMMRYLFLCVISAAWNKSF